MSYVSISPSQLAEKLKNGEKINLIDVREPIEYEIARIEAATLLPLSRFREWIDDLIAGLDRENETIVMCHHGVRSAHLCGFLVQNNVGKVFNLEGGIDAWSTEVDASVPRY
ncbi:MAG TPA: rhodanese-like domain-containing protein [Pyrinomonadaceae bacterium]|nr:rhodanese-like domain-containing protein [Pyrinomonadaceae bacterium]